MLIIDVFNVLHAAGPAGIGRLDAARLRALIAHTRWSGEQIVLVYDGTGGPSVAAKADPLRPATDAGLDFESRGAGISEVHAGRRAVGLGGAGGGGGVDADAVIESLLEREEHMGRGRLAVVVSSDKRIRAAAAGARAKSMTSAEFLRLLAEDVRKRHARERDQSGGRPEFAQDGGMDAGRTEYWLNELGVGDARSGGSVGERERGPDGGRREECAPDINPDDVDMGKILKAEGNKQPPERDRDEEQGPRKKRRR